MRLAQRLRTEHIYPLAAGLFNTVKILEDINNDFPDLRQVDRTYLVISEWRRRKESRKRKEETGITAGQIAKILQDAGIDHHLMCLVCEVFYEFNSLIFEGDP